MEFPVKLRNRIIEFLSKLPNIQEAGNQRALIYQAGLDSKLEDQISFGKPSSQFFSSLLPILINYGKLEDGRDALEAVLEAAKNYIGQDRKVKCERLIEEVRSYRHNTSQEFPTQINRPKLPKNTVETKQTLSLKQLIILGFLLFFTFLSSLLLTCFNILFFICYMFSLFDELNRSVLEIVMWNELDGWLCDIPLLGKWLSNNPFTVGFMLAIVGVLSLVLFLIILCWKNWIKRNEFKDLIQVAVVLIVAIVVINLVMMGFLALPGAGLENYWGCLKVVLMKIWN